DAVEVVRERTEGIAALLALGGLVAMSREPRAVRLAEIDQQIDEDGALRIVVGMFRDRDEDRFDLVGARSRRDGHPTLRIAGKAQVEVRGGRSHQRSVRELLDRLSAELDALVLPGPQLVAQRHLRSGPEAVVRWDRDRDAGAEIDDRVVAS